MASSSPTQISSPRGRTAFGVNRALLASVGALCLVIAVVAALSPVRLFDSIVWLVGATLLCSAAAKAIQLLPASNRGSSRGLMFILAQVALDLLLGLLLFTHEAGTARLVALGFGLLLIVEGVLLLLLGLRSSTVRGRVAMWAAGLIVAGLGLAIALGLVTDPIAWAGPIVGLKLALFGFALLNTAIQGPDTDTPLLYETVIPALETGEVYACYFGTAFHLGVAVGDGRMIHYTDKNLVSEVTWEGFLQGRVPQHWTYPDLDPVPAELVVETARSELGNTYPYNLLTCNCENFAIYCKSGGKTRNSSYAQIVSSVEAVKDHPLLGMVVSINTRVVEWLAFQFGGPSGRRLSLTIRRVGNAVTAWLVSRGREVNPPAPPLS